MNGTNGQTITVCGNVFRLVETIGRGSYGTVHKAINLSSGAAVAIKLIGKDKIRRPHERRSIEKEIETMRVAVEQYENGHPHIVRLLCTKESQHHIFIVLEYCAGGDIAAYIKLNRGLKEEQARIYMSQLATGLQFLRSQKIVHRDLKPANLLLSSKNVLNAKLKIADFGFARELQQESLAESVVGSPLYMAPELLEYKSYDAKADLWSVGIILYEMLVNDHPFLVVENSHATNHFALRKNIYRYFQLYGRIKLPASINVSKECLDLLEGLLRVNPQERISFEDFFRASFILPPVPTEARDSTFNSISSREEMESSDSSNKQALVHEKTPSELYDSDDEYVLVEMEYEDVGRKVLQQKDDSADSRTSSLPSTSSTPSAIPPPPMKTTRRTAKAIVPVESSMGTTPLGRTKTVSPTDTKRECALRVEEKQEIAVETEAKMEKEIVATTSMSIQEPIASEERREWAYDDSNLEELLGICYKSFACGSVALFVPTPLGDYIGFHEGCPHYYLSMESIEAAKIDGKNPPYVLGCIVFIEDYETTAISNPFNLRDGTPYHVVTVTALSTTGSNQPKYESGSDKPHLPMSQMLASRSPRNESGVLTGPTGMSSAGPTTSFVRTDAIVAAPQGVFSTQHQRISFRSFHISHLALFFLKSGKLPYVAFNEGAPHYYLSSESITAAKGDEKNLPAYICGEIIFIDTFQATEDFNPYKLPYGTRFHVVTIVNPKRT